MAGTAYAEGWEDADAGSAQQADEAEEEELQQQHQQTRRRHDMLPRLRLCPHRPRKHCFERRLQGAARLAASCLRRRVTLPAEMEEQGNWQDAAVLLPRVSCAFRDCSGIEPIDEAGAGRDCGVTFEDRTLRYHILRVHKEEIQHVASVADDEE